MIETVAGNVRREAGKLVWFEPMEPLTGIGRVVMTTRGGGISQPPYESLNLGFHVGDIGERVRLNRLSLFRALGKGLLEPVVGEQVHGSCARAVGELHAGTRWERNERSLAETDALVTAACRLPLVTLVADCVPVALVDPVQKVAAVAHGGWRGLAAGILENALAAMSQSWGSAPADVVAWVGPAIGPCCYEVGQEVARHFPGAARPGTGGRSFLDLRSAARSRLTSAGLVDENVTGLDLCTSCRPDLFFSHRRATNEGQPATGRQALIVWLDP
jgi:purine-nucleoside/S-methyl-5'-thioadenosine phosphorylase / adenosine deaminase